jgi:predicted nucleic acid-binding protein
MNNYIIDSNIIFSALLSGNKNYIKLFTEYSFFMPEFGLIEIEKYKEMLLNKTKIDSKLFREFVLLIFERITIVPNFLISDKSWNKAIEFCKDIDEKDSPYLALALELNIPLITRDKKLKDGLIKYGFTDIKTFDELF